MDLSQPNVALHIHTAQPGVKRGPHLAVQKRHVDNLYNVRVENMEGKCQTRICCAEKQSVLNANVLSHRSFYVFGIEIDPYYDSR
jgi:hypothetical protein